MVIIGDWYHNGNSEGWSDMEIRSKCKAGTIREHEAYVASGYILRPEEPAVTDLDSLANAIANKYGITVDLLRSRQRAYTMPRRDFCYQASTTLGLTNKIIAYYLGGRDPSSVSYQVWMFVRGVGRNPPNRRNTHCKMGHEWTEDNTYTAPDGKRSCRACRKQWAKNPHQRERKRLIMARLRLRGRRGEDRNLSTQLAAINERLVASRKRPKYPIQEG